MAPRAKGKTNIGQMTNIGLDQLGQYANDNSNTMILFILFDKPDWYGACSPIPEMLEKECGKHKSCNQTP